MQAQAFNLLKVMRISPLDIKKQEFSRTIRRGYDPEEVQAFLDMLASQWEDLLADQRRTEEKVRELKAKMDHYEKVEEALQEALRTARESSKHTLDNAKQEAVLIIKQAKAEGEDLSREAVKRRDGLIKESNELLGRRDEIVARLRSFLRAESEILERFEGRHADAAALRQRDKDLPVVAVPDTVVADLNSTQKASFEAPAEPQEPQDVIQEVVEEPVIEEPVIEEPVAHEPIVEEVVIEEPVIEEPVATEATAPEIEVEVIEKAPLPEIEVEVISEEPSKKGKSRKKGSGKSKRSDTPEALPEPFIEGGDEAGFFMDDVPSHFSDEEEPLSFTFFEPNEEEAATFLMEAEDATSFAPPPEDAGRKNGQVPRPQDRSPSDGNWVVRPVVSSSGAPSEPNQSDEIDKIRRILSDLD